MQEVSTTNEQKQCNNPETSNAIARGNTVHTDCHLKDTVHVVCRFLLPHGYLQFKQ